MAAAGATSAKKSADLEEIRIVIRSLLTTFKHGCTVEKLSEEYEETCGSQLPVRILGYGSAADLLKDMTDVARFSTNNEGERVVFAVSTQNTRHVADLVKKQKSAPKKIKKKSYMHMKPKRYGENLRPVLRLAQNRRPVVHSQPMSVSHNRQPFVARQPVVHEQPVHLPQKSADPQPIRQLNVDRPSVFSRLSLKHVQGFMDTEKLQAASSFDHNRDELRPKQKLHEHFKPFVSIPNSRPPNSNSVPLQSNFSQRSSNAKVKHQLELLCQKLSLSVPIYKSLSVLKGTAFLCSVHVGTHSVGSIDEFPSLEAAECAAAANLIKTLNKNYKVNKQISNEVPQTISVDKLIQNVLILLEKYPGGIISNALEKEYFKRFNESVPVDWISQLKSNANEILSFDKFDNTRFIVGKKIVQSALKNASSQPNSASQKAIFKEEKVATFKDHIPLSSIFTNIVGLDDKCLPMTAKSSFRVSAAYTSSKPERQLSASAATYKPDVSVSAAAENSKSKQPASTSVACSDFVKGGTDENSICSKLSGLTFKLETASAALDDADDFLEDCTELPAFSDVKDEMEVFVVFAADPSDFNVQPTSHIGDLNTLNNHMLEFYNSSYLSGQLKIKTGIFYAAFIRKSWFRVLCIDDKIPNLISVFLVDFGECAPCSSSMIRPLDTQFRRLPMLSIPCYLHGLKPFDKYSYSYDENCSNYFRAKVSNKIYKAVVKEKTDRKHFSRISLKHLSVDLIDVESGEKVSDCLVERKFAVKY